MLLFCLHFLDSPSCPLQLRSDLTETPHSVSFVLQFLCIFWKFLFVNIYIFINMHPPNVKMDFSLQRCIFRNDKQSGNPSADDRNTWSAPEEEYDTIEIFLIWVKYLPSGGFLHQNIKTVVVFEDYFQLQPFFRAILHWFYRMCTSTFLGWQNQIFLQKFSVISAQQQQMSFSLVLPMSGVTWKERAANLKAHSLGSTSVLPVVLICWLLVLLLWRETSFLGHFLNHGAARFIHKHSCLIVL